MNTFTQSKKLVRLAKTIANNGGIENEDNMVLIDQFADIYESGNNIKFPEKVSGKYKIYF